MAERRFKLICAPSDTQSMVPDQERIAGIVVADATVPGFPLQYVSPGFEALTGYRAAQLLGRPCSILQGPDTDPRAVDVMRNALGDGREAYVTLLNYRRDGTPFWNEVALAAERDAGGRIVRYLGVSKDVTASLAAQERIRELSHFDPLTGLVNRGVLYAELSRALDAARVRDRQLAVLCVDLDDFTAVNDGYGYAAGDLVLRSVADRLRAAVRPVDILARAGADEFLLLVQDVADVQTVAEDLAHRAVMCLRDPIILPDGRQVDVRASVGVSAYPRDAGSLEDLLGHAAGAMAAARRAGSDRFLVHRRSEDHSASGVGPDFDLAQAVVDLPAILAAGAIAPVFQPIVSVESDEIVGYEALARGPRGSALERPDRLFAAAEAAGLITELDWLCRARAVQEALATGLGRCTQLFLNCEPSAIGTDCPERHAEVWARGQAELDLVLEITERAVTSRPADLSRVVGEHRAAGRGIALDDVGADVRSLALLPFIAPNVIKLDLRLVQDRPSTDQAAIVSAVAAESERTGAAILAEGIETDAHLAVALSLGATLAQGFRWGHPAPLALLEREREAAAPGDAPEVAGAAQSGPMRLWRRPSIVSAPHPGRTPYEVVAAECPTAEATKRLLMPMSHHLENRALRIGEGAVLLSAFQDARHFTPRTISRYRLLARGASFVAAFGVGLEANPVDGVRGACISGRDPLTGEWSVIVVGPHFAGALVARDLGDRCRESDRRFQFATTYRRELTIAAARTLLERVAPLDAVSVSAKLH